MPITIDQNEKNQTIRDCADRIRLLRYPNPSDPSSPFSFDVEIETQGGQRLRGERKEMDDFVGSFLNSGSLDRQASNVDFLVVEWNPVAELAGEPTDSMRKKQYQIKMSAAWKHLARLSLSMPVVLRWDAHDTAEFYRYLERYEGDLRAFENRLNVRAPTLREKMVRSLFASVDAKTYAEEIEPFIDWPALVEALNLPEWQAITQVKNRIQKGLMPDGAAVEG